eukprot:429573-Pelagomonas_calceolata.AAC.7
MGLRRTGRLWCFALIFILFISCGNSEWYRWKASEEPAEPCKHGKGGQGQESTEARADGGVVPYTVYKFWEELFSGDRPHSDVSQQQDSQRPANDDKHQSDLRTSCVLSGRSFASYVQGTGRAQDTVTQGRPAQTSDVPKAGAAQHPVEQVGEAGQASPIGEATFTVDDGHQGLPLGSSQQHPFNPEGGDLTRANKLLGGEGGVRNTNPSTTDGGQMRQLQQDALGTNPIRVRLLSTDASAPPPPYPLPSTVPTPLAPSPPHYLGV